MPGVRQRSMTPTSTTPYPFMARKGLYLPTLVAATTAAVTPPVAGYVAWFDASDTASITASSHAVSQWNDKSGNGYHITQGTGAAQPSSGTRSINSLNSVDFDGGDSLTNSVFSLTGVNTGTAFVVVLADSGVNDGIFSMPADNDDYLGSSDIRWFGIDGTNFYSFGNNGYRGQVARTLSAAQQLTMQRNGDTTSIWKNGSAGTGATGQGTTNFAANRLVVGAAWVAGAAATGFDGAICELILYSTVLSAGNRQLVEAYLKAKWATP